MRPTTNAEPPSAYYQKVARYFDEEATGFADRYWANRTLQRIRQTFRDVTGRHAFASALEIGCGPGLDLEYWGRQRPDARICGLDVSPAMVHEAGQRVRSAGLNNVEVTVGSVEDIAARFPGVRFDLVYVYFGALNTVEDLGRAAQSIRACLSDRGTAVLTFVNRWFIEEMLWFLVTLKWNRAFARLRTVWGGYAPNRPLASRCYAPSDLRRSFGGQFRIAHTEGFSIVHPAWHRDKWVRKFPRLCEALWRVDRALCHTPFWSLGEYALYVLQPITSAGGRTSSGGVPEGSQH